MEISKKVFDNRLCVYYNVDRVFARCVMLVNVQKIINAPGERIDFQFSLDLSDVDFGGLYPAQNPVVVTGDVRNTAGMLLLRFSADTVLKSVCDRCLENFDNPKRVACEYLLAQELADAENDDIVLLEDGAVDVGDLARTAMILEMDAKTMGTTIQNMRLINTVPRGLSTVASGHSQPTMQPRTMEPSMTARKA